MASPPRRRPDTLHSSDVGRLRCGFLRGAGLLGVRAAATVFAAAEPADAAGHVGAVYRDHH
jgi:hypothetical protein